MHEYLFEQSTLQTEAIFNFDALTPKERAVISSLINWNHPERAIPHIFDTSGRSIMLRDIEESEHNVHEDSFKGRHKALQLIGACGATEMVHAVGMYEIPKTFHFKRVSTDNHVEELQRISYVHRINENGTITHTLKPYVPLHGMDQNEAIKRRTMTNKIRAILQTYIDRGLTPSFTVPEFAAEGIFPDKKDIYGNPLYFQVYRIPKLHRFPSQMVHVADVSKDSYEIILPLIVPFSYYAGAMFRSLGDLDIAYLGGHGGNMSLIANKHKHVVFATDLGTAIEIENHPYKDRYRGLDAYIHIQSLYKFWGEYEKVLVEGYKVDPIAAQTIKANLTNDHLVGFMAGYMRDELLKIYKLDSKTNMYQLLPYANQLRAALLDILIATENDEQAFVEYFEHIFQSICGLSATNN